MSCGNHPCDVIPQLLELSLAEPQIQEKGKRKRKCVDEEFFFSRPLLLF